MNQSNKVKTGTKRLTEAETLQKLVESNPNFEYLSNGKIKCTLTNHELLPTLKEFNQYLNSKSYKSGVEKDFDFTQFLPYVEDHKKNRNKMFCNLTKQVISKKKSVVLKHVNGKRYKHYLQIYQEELEKENIKQQEKKKAKQLRNQVPDLEEEIELLQEMEGLNEADQQQNKQGIIKKGKKIQKNKKPKQN